MLLKYLILYITFFYGLNAERNFHVILTKFTCIPESSVFKNITCILSDRYDISYINIWIELSRDVSSLFMRAVLEASLPKRPKLKFMDLKQDICVFLRTSPKQDVVKLAHKYLTKFTNRLVVCPLEKNFTYIAKDMYVDVEDLPILMPELDFRLSRNFHVQLTKLECISEHGFFKNITCLLSERHNISYMNLWMQPSRYITALNMRAILEAAPPKRSKLKLMDFKQDLCIFLRVAPKQEVMKLAHKYLVKFINRIPYCPIDQNFTYIVKDYYVDVDDLPPLTPELDFRLTLFILEKNKVSFKFKGEGRIIHNNIMTKVRNNNKAVIGNSSAIG